MILGYLKFQDEKQTPELKNPVRCRSCFYMIEETADRCEFCGVIRQYAQPKTWMQKIKRWLGIEISSDLIVLTIDEPVNFFEESDIEEILDVKKIKVLDIDDVPNWNLMFYNSKRIGKPRGRRAPLNRQLQSNRPDPKLLRKNIKNRLLTK